MRLRMLGGTQVGYQRMTRRWWAPVRGELNKRTLGDAPCSSPSSNTHSLVQPRHRAGARARGRARGPSSSAAHHEDLQEELARFRDGRTDGRVGELPVLRGARLLRRRRPRTAEQAPRGRGRGGRRAHPLEDRAAGARPGHPAGAPGRLAAGPAAGRRRRRAPGPQRGGHRQHRLPPRRGRLQPAARGRRRLRRPARRLRPGQGGDAQRRRRRRDDLLGHPRRALGHDVLARQRLHRRRHRARPHVRHRPGQPARGDGQEHLPAEPRLPGLLLPRGVHGRRDGGRPYCNAVYEIADAERYPVGEAVNFSKLPIDFGIIHYASDTPYTQARTLGARGLSYYGMDSTYASSLAILRRVLRLEGALE